MSEEDDPLPPQIRAVLDKVRDGMNAALESGITGPMDPAAIHDIIAAHFADAEPEPDWVAENRRLGHMRAKRQTAAVGKPDWAKVARDCQARPDPCDILDDSDEEPGGPLQKMWTDFGWSYGALPAFLYQWTPTIDRGQISYLTIAQDQT